MKVVVEMEREILSQKNQNEDLDNEKIDIPSFSLNSSYFLL